MTRQKNNSITKEKSYNQTYKQHNGKNNDGSNDFEDDLGIPQQADD